MTNQEYLNKVANLGCIVCRLYYNLDTPAEIHHIRTGQGIGRRASDEEAIPLCPKHHRNGGYGVAYHAGKKGFEEKYGLELELLEEVKNLLNE